MTDTPLPPDAPIAVKDPSRLSLALQSDVLYQFKPAPVAVVSFAVVVLLVLSAVFAPLIAPYDPFDPGSLNPRWRVRAIIAEPVAARGGETAGLAEKLLEQVGLSARDAGKFPHEFSGGQRQRIRIARAPPNPS